MTQYPTTSDPATAGEETIDGCKRTVGTLHGTTAESASDKGFAYINHRLLMESGGQAVFRHRPLWRNHVVKNLKTETGQGGREQKQTATGKMTISVHAASDPYLE